MNKTPRNFERFKSLCPETGRLYRYRDSGYWGGEGPCCEEFVVIRRTPVGMWIRRCYDPFNISIRWISIYARRRSVWPTKVEALRSFIARKRKQQKILAGQLQRSRIEQDLADRLLKRLTEQPQKLDITGD